MDPLSALRSGLSAIGVAVWLIGRAARGAVADWAEGDPLAHRRHAAAMRTYLWGPLPTLLALAALVGSIAGISAARLLELYHAEMVVERVLARSLLQDVIPIVVGVFASGRVSVELAARLGGMSLTQQLDALEMLGHDPTRHVLSPSLVAVTASAPVHMLGASLCALAAAGFTLHANGITPIDRFAAFVINDRSADALLTGVAKALLFALLALGVGALVGSRGAREPGAIGRRATHAFTAGLLAILAAAALWTMLA